MTNDSRWAKAIKDSGNRWETVSSPISLGDWQEAVKASFTPERLERIRKSRRLRNRLWYAIKHPLRWTKYRIQDWVASWDQ